MATFSFLALNAVAVISGEGIKAGGSPFSRYQGTFAHGLGHAASTRPAFLKWFKPSYLSNEDRLLYPLSCSVYKCMKSLFFFLVSIRLEKVPKKCVASVKRDVHEERKGSRLPIFSPSEDQNISRQAKVGKQKGLGQAQRSLPTSSLPGIGSLIFSGN